MRRIVVGALAAALLAAAWPGYAQQHGPMRHIDGPKPMRPAAPPPPPPRELRGGPPGRPGPPPHLPPEERRQLRRDIADHGRDIYRDRGNQ